MIDIKTAKPFTKCKLFSKFFACVAISIVLINTQLIMMHVNTSTGNESLSLLSTSNITTITHHSANDISISIIDTTDTTRTQNDETQDVILPEGLTKTDMIWLNVSDSYNPNHNLTVLKQEIRESVAKGDKCNLLNQIILWQGHHKTGSFPFASFCHIILDYCNFSNPNNRITPEKRIYYFHYHWQFRRDVLWNYVMDLIHYNAIDPPKTGLYFVNLIRDPVSVVISGFNYHSLKPYPLLDEWVHYTFLANRSDNRIHCIIDGMYCIYLYVHVRFVYVYSICMCVFSTM